MNVRRAIRRGLAILVGAALLIVITPAAPALALPVLTVSSQQVFGAPGAEEDWFGCSSAVYGDTAIVGARGDDGGRGAAYVFVRSGGVWWLQQKLTVTPTGGFEDEFGVSVALWGDTALIGAWSADGGLGAAYVFTRRNATWTQRAKLTPAARAVADSFGGSVALAEGTALIGAYGADSLRGAAYVFTGAGTSWTERAKLVAMDRQPADFFGESVALSGDTALVGAWGDEGMRGSAYVFTGSGSAWSQSAKLAGAGSTTQDSFGISVALSGDTAIVGAYGDDAKASSAGAAYVFTGSGSSWTQRQKLTASDAAASDWFGHSVAISGGTALVGAHGNNSEQGSAYVFTGSGGSWAERANVSAPLALDVDQFGASVAISGGNALVGAWLDDTGIGGPDAGSACFLSFKYLPPLGVTRIAGANRYATAVAASSQGFPAGAASVVIATGANWPDALGGSALAGAVSGPLLLTKRDALPSEVTAEVRRLGAVRAYILGSTAAVGAGVENALVGKLGRENVVRLGGANRYETAQKVADEAVRLKGLGFTGTVFVATGANYPDATAASPIAYLFGAPVILVSPTSTSVALPAGTTKAVILGSTAAVSAPIEDYLVARLGRPNVWRQGGANRYDTACQLAFLASFFGVKADAIGLATGTNFPDALTAGPMLAQSASALVLTRPTILPGETKALLQAASGQVKSMFIFGDHNAVSPAVEAQAKAAAGL